MAHCVTFHKKKTQIIQKKFQFKIIVIWTVPDLKKDHPGKGHSSPPSIINKVV